MNTATLTLAAAAASLALAGPAIAEEDHGHATDIGIEIEGGAIHIHPEGYGLFANDEVYVFTKPASTWRSLAPGFDGHDLGNAVIFDLIGVTPLYAFNGTSFVQAGDEFLRVVNSELESIDITGTTVGDQVLSAGVGVTSSDGELHVHPIFQLLTTGVGDPADGAYLAGFRAASSGLTTSDPFWILFHKGLGEEAYHDAIHEAEEQFGIRVVPEPTSLALLAATGAVLLRRRRTA